METKIDNKSLISFWEGYMTKVNDLKVDNNELEKLKIMIQKEIDNFIVKDTYTKEKNAGLRKALAFIDDIERGY